MFAKKTDSSTFSRNYFPITLLDGRTPFLHDLWITRLCQKPKVNLKSVWINVFTMTINFFIYISSDSKSFITLFLKFQMCPKIQPWFFVWSLQLMCSVNLLPSKRKPLVVWCWRYTEYELLDDSKVNSVRYMSIAVQ